jgi:hypothetical protein
MAFDTFDQRMKVVAERAVAHCKQQFGGNGFVIEQGIHSSISWRPTFYCRPTSTLIVGVEVVDNLYPEVLKGAAHDIGFYDHPIAVYQACSLEAYQKDSKQAKINLLRQHGFGIITVDEDGIAVVQSPSVPLAQHIPENQLEAEIKPLTSRLKVGFRAAHKTYGVNIGQGLQQAGQIVEAIVTAMAREAVKKGHITTSAGSVASVIDTLYQSSAPLVMQRRAELGAARAFINQYRNTASHPAKSAKQAYLKMRKCKEGFISAIETASKLQKASHSLGYKLRVHTT